MEEEYALEGDLCKVGKKYNGREADRCRGVSYREQSARVYLELELYLPWRSRASLLTWNLYQVSKLTATFPSIPVARRVSVLSLIHKFAGSGLSATIFGDNIF